jgi:hypothetical protein
LKKLLDECMQSYMRNAIVVTLSSAVEKGNQEEEINLFKDKLMNSTRLLRGLLAMADMRSNGGPGLTNSSLQKHETGHADFPTTSFDMESDKVEPTLLTPLFATSQGFDFEEDVGEYDLETFAMLLVHELSTTFSDDKQVDYHCANLLYGENSPMILKFTTQVHELALSLDTIHTPTDEEYITQSLPAPSLSLDDCNDLITINWNYFVPLILRTYFHGQKLITLIIRNWNNNYDFFETSH